MPHTVRHSPTEFYSEYQHGLVYLMDHARLLFTPALRYGPRQVVTPRPLQRELRLSCSVHPVITFVQRILTREFVPVVPKRERGPLVFCPRGHSPCCLRPPCSGLSQTYPRCGHSPAYPVVKRACVPRVRSWSPGQLVSPRHKRERGLSCSNPRESQVQASGGDE